jgi:hypothetical protein
MRPPSCWRELPLYVSIADLHQHTQPHPAPLPFACSNLTRELLDYLSVCDSEFKPDLTAKIATLIQRYAPDKRWHIDSMLQVRGGTAWRRGRVMVAVCGWAARGTHVAFQGCSVGKQCAFRSNQQCWPSCTWPMTTIVRIVG